jgi:hypothetical protein
VRLKINLNVRIPKMKSRKATVILIVLLVFGSASRISAAQSSTGAVQSEPAQLNAGKTLVTEMTLDSFQKRVQVLGYTPARGKDEKGKDNNYFTFRAEGHLVVAKALTPHVLLLYVAYTGGTTLEAMNEWNINKTGSTAYIVKSGDACLSSDLNISGGVAQDNIDAFINSFRDKVVTYAQFVSDHPKPPTAK